MRLKHQLLFLAGATASISLLSNQPAHAAFTGCGTTMAMGMISDLVPGFSCLVGDKLYSNFDTDLPGVVGISMAENGGTQHTLNVASAGTFNSATKFNYTITATNCGPFCLSTWQTDTLGAVGTNNYNVNVDWTGDAIAAIDLSLVPGPSSSFPPLRNFNPNLSSSDVTHLITNGGSLTGITDTVTQTPGPLPILGAGAVFGFSRKLRSRIKASA